MPSLPLRLQPVFSSFVEVGIKYVKLPGHYTRMHRYAQGSFTDILCIGTFWCSVSAVSVVTVVSSSVPVLCVVEVCEHLTDVANTDSIANVDGLTGAAEDCMPNPDGLPNGAHRDTVMCGFVPLMSDEDL